LVPVKNGAVPEAPEGGHKSQAGALPELPAVADDDPPEPDCEALAADEFGPAPTGAPPAEEGPSAEPTGAAAALEGAAVVAGNLTAPYGVAKLLPAMPEVWAAAGSASTAENRNAR
jgi:hypothetical protein